MLSDDDCRAAVCPPTKKRVRLTDAEGLYLEVSPRGSKRWFWKFYTEGKESRLALGSYPAVGLVDAQRARDAARLQKQNGVNPAQVRRADRLKAGNPAGKCFREVALEWHAKQLPVWSEGHGICLHGPLCMWRMNPSLPSAWRAWAR